MVGSQGRNTSPLRNHSEPDNGCKCVTSTNMRSYHQWQDSLTWACVSTIAAPHMISIISNDELRFVKIFRCLMPCIGPIHNLNQTSVSNAWDIRKSEKMYWFRVGGTHIDVTTLARKVCFCLKSEPMMRFARCSSQNQLDCPLKFHVFWQKR